MAILDKARALLGLSDSSADAQLQIQIDDVTQATLDYCKIDVLPPVLETMVAKRAVFLFQRSKSDPNVSSIKEGLTEIKFTDQAPDVLDEDIKNRLQRYRVRKARIR